MTAVKKKSPPPSSPNCDRGIQYAKDVVSGKVVACSYIRGACFKFLRELDDKLKPYWFDFEAAEKYLRTVQKFEHVIGTWKTKRIIYEPWQCFVWMNIMGFRMKETGFRRFRTAHIEVARGNAKSAMASQAALYFLALDNPNGNYISTVATKKEQARIVLDSARMMAMKNLSFLRHTGVKVLAHNIVHPKSGSQVRSLASEHKGLDGLNDVLGICDELHAMKRDTFEVITSGMAKRPDSLTLCITTAGHDVHSVGCSQSSYAKKICLGEVEDDTFFAVVYTLDEGDDWADESVWIKANPNLGVSVDLPKLRATVQKAIETPADIPGIQIKNMNLWIAEAKAYFTLSAWDKCAVPGLNIKDFKGRQCRMGLDLASHIDIASIAVVFRDKTGYDIFTRNYIPQETIDNEKNTLYLEAVAKGELIATPGAAISYEFIQKEILSIAKDVSVIECLYDAWNATETAQKLSNKVEMMKVAMNVANFSEPMKKFDASMRKGETRHDGSKLLRWCVGNVVAKEDHNQNVFPRKSHEKLKIDPVIAILMGMAGWIQDEDGESSYEEHGLRTVGGKEEDETDDQSSEQKIETEEEVRDIRTVGFDDENDEW